MRKLIRTAGLAVALAATAISSAGATTGPAMLTSASPTGTGSNTGAVSGNSSSYAGHAFTFDGGATKYQCVDTNFQTTNVTTAAAQFNVSYGGCTYSISGTVLGTATVDTTSGWTLLFNHAAYNDATGAGTGITLTRSFTKVTVPGIGCTVDILHQTNGGFTSQSITSSGASTAIATPWGSRIDANVTGLTFTSTGTCPGISEHGDGGYVGTLAIPNLWSMR